MCFRRLLPWPLVSPPTRMPPLPSRAALPIRRSPQPSTCIPDRPVERTASSWSDRDRQAGGAIEDLLARLWNPRLADVRLPRLRKPADPVANRSYIARGLDIPVSAMTDLVTLTGPWDAGARFAAST